MIASMTNSGVLSVPQVLTSTIGVGTANPAAPADIGIQNGSGYSLKLSSGIDMPAGTVDAGLFEGSGAALTNVSANLTSCPAGMGLMGTGRSSYCVDLSTESASASWDSGAQTCLSAGKRLCTFMEWAEACAHLAGWTYTSTQWEWVADPYANNLNNAVIVGGGGCFYSNNYNVTFSEPFRCCQR